MVGPYRYISTIYFKEPCLPKVLFNPRLLGPNILSLENLAVSQEKSEAKIFNYQVSNDSDKDYLQILRAL